MADTLAAPPWEQPVAAPKATPAAAAAPAGAPPWEVIPPWEAHITIPAEEIQKASGQEDPLAPGNTFLTAVAQDPKQLLQVPGAVLKTAGDLVRGAAADVVSKVTGEPEYGGNLKAITDPLNDGALPVDKFLAGTAAASPALTTAAKIAQGVAGSAPLMAAGLPGGVVGRLAALGFSAQMLKSGSDAATALGTELGKNPEDRDPDKITSAVSDLVQAGAFAPLTGAHGLKPEAKAAVIEDVAKKILQQPAASVSAAPMMPKTPPPWEAPGGAAMAKPVQTDGQTTSEPAVTPAAQVQPSPPAAAMAPAVPAASPSEALPMEGAQTEIIGMGGATPSEFEPVKPFVTGIRNAVVDQDRAARGLPPAMAAAQQTFGQWWDEAMQRIDENPKAQDDLIGELQVTPRPVTPVENALLLHRQVDLSNQLNKALVEAQPEYHSPGSSAAEEAQLHVARLQDDLHQLYDVTKAVGSEQGRGLAARNMLANESFDLASMQMQKRAANGGAPLTPEQVADVAAQHQKITATEQQAEAQAVKLDQSEAGRAGTEAVNDLTSKVTKQPSPNRDLQAEQFQIIAGLKKAVGNQEPLQNLGSYIQRLAENFVRQGVRERDPLVDAVHGVLTKHVDPQITRRQTMDAISGYGDFRPLNPDAVKVQLRDLKGQMQQVAKLEDIQGKKPLLKTGVERRTPSDEERRLQQQVNEAKRKHGVVTTDPAKQLKSALDAIKTRLKHSISDLEFQISTRQKIVKGKTQVQYDMEATALKAQRDKLQAQYNEIFQTPGLTDAQRVQNALRAVRDSADEYQRRIDASDTSPMNQGSKTPETPALAAERARRDALKAEYEHLRDSDSAYQQQQAEAALVRQKAALEQSIALKQKQLAAGPQPAVGQEVNRPADPVLEHLTQQRDALNQKLAEMRRGPKASAEEIQLKALKTRLASRIAEYQDRLAREDFQPRQRRTVTLDAEGQRLKAQADRAKLDFQHGLIKDRLNRRSGLEKGLDTFTKWRRGFLLSSPVTLAKLTAAAAWRLVTAPIEEGVGAVIGKVLPEIADRAPREGGLNVRAEAKALTEGLMRGLEDSHQILTSRRSDLDVLYGKGREGVVGQSDVEPKSIIDFFGQLHGALKAPVKRAEFARSFEKRVQWNINHGVDVHAPEVQMRIAVEAYKDASKSIFLQDNRVVSAYKRALSAFEEKDKTTGRVPAASKLAATGLRTLLPIVRVPTNIVAETLQYALGSVTGSVRVGIAMRRGVANLPPAQADLIMRDLKKGSLGAAMLTLGYLLPHAVGGYYQPGQKQDPNAVKPGNVKLFGHEVPSYLIHNPLLETLQLGATIRHVADSKLRRQDANQGIPAGIKAGALGVTEQVPFVREMFELSKLQDPRSQANFTGELAKSIAVPQFVQWLAAQGDKQADGAENQRAPQTVAQHVETGIPGLRENVPMSSPLMTSVLEKFRGLSSQQREALRMQLTRYIEAQQAKGRNYPAK